MRKIVTPAVLLLLAVVHTPVTAQARLFDFLPPDLFGLGASEPIVLFLTGLALLSLARFGTQAQQEEPAEHVAPAPPSATRRADEADTPSRRAA